jgi:phage shock protein E
LPRTPRALFALGLVAAAIFSACAGTSGGTSGGTPTLVPAREVAAAEAVQMLDAYTVIDVRTPEEYAAGHLAGAQNIDVEAADFEARIDDLDKAAPYLVYCRSGNRSKTAADLMVADGFTDVVDAGGMQALIDAGAPTE